MTNEQHHLMNTLEIDGHLNAWAEVFSVYRSGRNQITMHGLRWINGDENTEDAQYAVQRFFYDADDFDTVASDSLSFPDAIPADIPHTENEAATVALYV